MQGSAVCSIMPHCSRFPSVLAMRNSIGLEELQQRQEKLPRQAVFRFVKIYLTKFYNNWGLFSSRGNVEEHCILRIGLASPNTKQTQFWYFWRHTHVPVLKSATSPPNKTSRIYKIKRILPTPSLCIGITNSFQGSLRACSPSSSPTSAIYLPDMTNFR